MKFTCQSHIYSQMQANNILLYWRCCDSCCFLVFKLVYIENTRWASLPGKVLRTLVDSTSNLKAEAGKLDIKRRKPGILFISLTLLAIMTYFSIFVSIQRHWPRYSKGTKNGILFAIK